ncbi:hypothetical protein ACSL0S_23125, partial [Salmonella enterica]
FGQPVGTCSFYAGSLCLYTRLTLSWLWRVVAVPQIMTLYY